MMQAINRKYKLHCFDRTNSKAGLLSTEEMTLTDIRYTLMGFMGNSGLLWFHGLIELISNLFNKTEKKICYIP